MSILENHPPFTAFLENEVKTLEHLNSRGLLKTYPELASYISVLSTQFRARLKKKQVFNFEFHHDFAVNVEKHVHRIVVGANVAVDYEICSYFLALAGKGEEDKEIIRKFHFDYARPDIETHNSVPLFHMQYGGKLSPELIATDYKSSKLDCWLSLPRLNYRPINLALLFDLLFCEFRTEETNKIVENDEWRSLIFDNERFIAYSYFNNISKHLNSARYKKESLIRDLCYGQQS